MKKRKLSLCRQRMKRVRVWIEFLALVLVILIRIIELIHLVSLTTG